MLCGQTSSSFRAPVACSFKIVDNHCKAHTSYYFSLNSCSILHVFFLPVRLASYRGISDSGCSQIRTTSLQRTQLEAPTYFLAPNAFWTSQRGQPPYKGHNTVPKCMSFIRTFHCDSFPPVAVFLLENTEPELS